MKHTVSLGASQVTMAATVGLTNDQDQMKNIPRKCCCCYQRRMLQVFNHVTQSIQERPDEKTFPESVVLVIKAE